MDFLSSWWGGLDSLTRWFFSAASVFSIFLLWQMIMAFVGLTGGDGAPDSQAESVDVHHSPADSDASVAAFKLLSFRSIVAFFTLFFWSGGLALQRQSSLARAMGGAAIGRDSGPSAALPRAARIRIQRRPHRLAAGPL